MTYSEDIISRGTLTRKQTETILDDHGFTLAEFIRENGDESRYPSKAVMYWLGY